MAFWGIEVKSTKPFTHSPGQGCGRLRISQATLGFGPGNGKSVVQCNVGKKSPVLLCSLLPDKAESCHLELEFEEAEEVTFSVIGPRSVHLTGYYVGNFRRSMGLNDDSESFGEDVGDTESSEYNNDEDEYEDSFIDDGDLEVSPLLPSLDGGGTDMTTLEDSWVDRRAFKRKTKKKKSDITKSARKRLKKKYESSDSEDIDVTTSNNSACDLVHDQIAESEDDQIPISSVCGTSKTIHEDSKRKKHHVADCTADEDQSEDRNVEKKKKKRKTNKENSALADMPSTVNLDEGMTKSTMERRETKTDNGTKMCSDGLVVEDIKIGEPDGKVASSGKKVTIHYTGMLKKSGEVFDSSVGKKPLKFRLGKGDALDGMDRGIEGMRVGGKRRLLIPPTLGYGGEGTDRVPPNSWLMMDVELLRVRK